MDLGRRVPRRGSSGRCVERLAHRRATFRQGPAEHAKLADLLHRERQPAFDIRIEVGFELEIDRRVQQRARWRDLHAILAELCDHRLQPIEDRRQVRPPDVAAVDDAEGQHQIFTRTLDDCCELIGRTHQIEVKACHRQLEREVEVVTEAAEVGRQHDLEAGHGVGKRAIGLAQRLPRRIVEIEHEARFVDLDPACAGGFQFAQNFGVDGNEPIQQREPIERSIMALSELQEGYRPDQHRARLISEALRLQVLLDRLARSERERLTFAELGHHVVVVGVEPFCHFLRRRAVRVMRMTVFAERSVALRPSRHREVCGKRNLATVPPVHLGNGAHHRAGVEDVVVEREVVGRNDGDPKRLLSRPVGDTQRAGRFLELVFADLAGPEAFERELQFTARTDAGHAQCRDGKRG